MYLWELHYHRDVVAYLVALREEGHDLRKAIFSLQKTEGGIPPENVTVLKDDIFLWIVHEHEVTFSLTREKKRIFVSACEKVKEESGEEE
jgi:hypothetical protein